MTMDAPPEAESPAARRFGLAARLLVLALLVPALAYVGYLAIVLGPELAHLQWADLVRGYHRTLTPAEVRGPVLRTDQGGADLIYVLTTQSERLVPLRLGRASRIRARQMLHADLWTFDAATAQPAWRRRVRTFADRGELRFALLGADATTLWLFIREPIGVSLRDGAIVADGARLDAVTPGLAGKRVDEEGFVAFGAQGLQVTLSDSTQWVIDGESFTAQPRATARTQAERIAPPAYDASYSSSFQLRGMSIGTMWLGVLTDAEAARLQAPPVVPGAKPGERRGVMADFLEEQHAPDDLRVAPLPYRLWSARLTKVSAAPRDWPKQLPDNWGTRDEFSDYTPLPEAPPFLQAGLLGNGSSEQPFWLRRPDSVLVLHHDKVGPAGRLRVARVSGPAGRLVWDAPLDLAELDASLFGAGSVAFVGSVPNPTHDPQSETSREHDQVVVAIDVASGSVARYDLTAESLLDTTPAMAAADADDARLER